MAIHSIVKGLLTITSWIKRGMAIHSIVKGLLTITSPLNEKSNSKVNNRATMDTGVSTCKNFSLNHCSPLVLIIHLRE